MTKELNSIIFTGFLMVVFCFTAWEARSFAELAGFFPYFVSITAAITALISLILQSIKMMKTKEDVQVDKKNLLAVFKYILWIVGYLVLIFVIGFIFATILFLLLFLTFESKFRFIRTLFSTTSVVAVLLLFGNIMNLYWPQGILGWNFF